MNDGTLKYVRDSLAEYYEKNKLEFPPLMERREYGFLLYGEKVMARHIGFDGEGQALDWLRGMTPAHCFYSVAYYTYPGAPTMLEKKWQGADLIFDMDADHLPNAPADYGEMLRSIKIECIKLHEFLQELGFSDKDMSVAFSGSRGYHVHVTDTKVLQLKSPERREIVDYVTGTGLRVYGYDHDPMVKKNNPHILQNNGWGDRATRTIDRFLDGLTTMDEKAALKKLKGMGAGTAQARAVWKMAAAPRLQKGGRMILEAMEFFEQSEMVEHEAGAHIDEPVTADIKRLIRIPGTVHGKTGLACKNLKWSELDGFDPLVDAVVFGEEPVKTFVQQPITVELMGRRYQMTEGVGKLPRSLALFLMMRGAAEVV